MDILQSININIIKNKQKKEITVYYKFINTGEPFGISTFSNFSKDVGDDYE